MLVLVCDVGSIQQDRPTFPVFTPVKVPKGIDSLLTQETRTRIVVPSDGQPEGSFSSLSVKPSSSGQKRLYRGPVDSNQGNDQFCVDFVNFR